MSVPCGIFSHYLKLPLCVLKFQNPSNAPPLWLKQRALKTWGEPPLCIIPLRALSLSLSYPSCPSMGFNSCSQPPFLLSMRNLSAIGLFKILLNFEEAEWPLDDQNALLASCGGEHACVSVACMYKKKKKSFSLKRAEKGSVTSMKVNDASFPCPPPTPSHM